MNHGLSKCHSLPHHGSLVPVSTGGIMGSWSKCYSKIAHPGQLKHWKCILSHIVLEGDKTKVPWVLVRTFFSIFSLHFHRTSLYEQVKRPGSLVFLSIRTSIPPEDSTLLMSSTLVISEQLTSKPYPKRLALPMNYGKTEPFSWLTVFNTYLIRNKGKNLHGINRKHN